jgi:hypothetical protein
MARARALLCITALLATALPGGPALAAAQPSDMAVKAAFLSKFGSYVNWPPAAASGPVYLCIVGNDPFGGVIEAAIRGQQASGRPLQLRRFAGTDGASGCHIAFVQGANAAATASMLGSLRGKPILTVTDARAGGQQGMIHFVLQQGRVRFHIDDAAAAQSRLLISSRLLSLALNVRQRR